ncbi:MAG: hypothetical protein JO001_06800 [Alphaproteobacteria bacterium]|nr:hypothetical protein [Alphaproteobacteria bacterium]
MSARRPNDIPPATDELLAAGQRRVGEGPRLNLRGLKPAGIDDDDTERHVEEITQSYGAHAQIPRAKTRASAPLHAPAPVARSAASQRTRYVSFRFELPDYLDEELRLTAARGKGTKNFLLMEALQKAGYTVHPEDLVPDRRKTRFQRD